MTVAGKDVIMANGMEQLRMGGPYTGDVFIGDEFIDTECVFNNFIYQEERGLFFFVKYHEINLYKYFTINFYNINNKMTYEFEREFDMVHLGDFVSENELEIYHAFHNKFENKKQIFNLDDEDFNQIN